MWFDSRPSSFRSRFEHDRDLLLAGTTVSAPLVTEADLAPLPPLMHTYLRRGGAVGRPRVRNMRVTFKAQMRSSATAAWMQATFTFETTGTTSVRATYRNAGFTVSAILTFNDEGDLVGFVSDDRAHDRDEGPATWSTPISGYREVDGIRVGSRGDANWIDASGEWTYGRFEITSLAYNVTSVRR